MTAASDAELERRAAEGDYPAMVELQRRESSAAIEQEDRMVHADQLDPVRMLSGRMLEKTDAEVLGEIDGSLRWARWIFSEMVQDKKVSQHWRDQAELFLEDEAAQSELCWLWEHPEE